MEIKIAYQRDGLTIRGHAYGANRKGMHAVIVSHGFLANEKMCTQYAKVLADLGFLAVTFDFCSGGIRCSSDGRMQDMTVLSEKEDLKAVIKGVREQFLPADISLMGCSQGGFVSGLLAKELGSQQIKQLIQKNRYDNNDHSPGNQSVCLQIQSGIGHLSSDADPDLTDHFSHDSYLKPHGSGSFSGSQDFCQDQRQCSVSEFSEE
jgi:predicted acylesterase/phospholipase RssA